MNVNVNGNGNVVGRYRNLPRLLLLGLLLALVDEDVDLAVAPAEQFGGAPQGVAGGHGWVAREVYEEVVAADPVDQAGIAQDAVGVAAALLSILLVGRPEIGLLARLERLPSRMPPPTPHLPPVVITVGMLVVSIREHLHLLGCAWGQ